MMKMSWWPEDPCVDDDVVLDVVIRHRDATVSYLWWWASCSRSYSFASPILQGLASTSARYYLGRSELVPLFLSQPSCSCASPPRWTCRSTPAKSSTCSKAWSCTHWSPGTTPWQPSEAWAAACLECPTFFLLISNLLIFIFFAKSAHQIPASRACSFGWRCEQQEEWATLVIRFVVEVFRGFYLV